MYLKTHANQKILIPVGESLKKMLQGLFGFGTIITFFQWIQYILVWRNLNLLLILVIGMFMIEIFSMVPLYMFYLKISGSSRFKLPIQNNPLIQGE
jgi:hypothetical protein